MNDKRNGFSLEGDLGPVIKGDVPLPNVEDVDPMLFLNNLASVGHGWMPQWGYALIEGRKAWAYFYLTSAGMGGALDGGGYAVIYRSPGYDLDTKRAVHKPRVVRFAICKHEKVASAGANPRRGWHPGACKHCGLDMTVDSGD